MRHFSGNSGPTRIVRICALYCKIVGKSHKSPALRRHCAALGGLLPQLLLQFAASQNMTKNGMLPMSLLDQNMFDRFQSMQLTNMHQQMMSLGAEVDQGRQMQTMRGLLATAGVPWGQEQQDASRRITDILRIGTPLLAQLAPDFLDQLGGLRGSAAVMGHYAFYGSRMRIDPLTGRTGMDMPALQSFTQQLPERLFGGEGYKTGLTISEGDAGRMFAALQQRGMVAGADAAKNAGVVNQAMDRLGFKDKTLDQLSAGEMKQLQLDPGVAGALNVDTGRITGAIRKYQSVLNAMREIFGDAGNPNAPMPELINALQAFSGGALSQMQPGQLEMMVRTNYNMAKQTGMGPSGFMMMGQYGMQQATQAGLNPVFGALAAQSGLALTGAYQQLGLGGYQAWGRGDISTQGKLAVDLMTAAAGSTLGNQVGLAMRLAGQAPCQSLDRPLRGLLGL